MKKLILVWLTGAALIQPSRAQLFSPEALGGAFWGSLIGGIAGSDCHHGFSGEGAAIGAGVGLVAGAIAGEARRHDYYGSPTYAYAPAPAPAVSFGLGYGNCGSSAYVYYSPNSYCAPGYYYQPTRPNYAVNGTLLGAASGALIGSASHDAGAGAAIGAAAGLVLGGVAEASARNREQKAPVQSNPAQSAPPSAQTPTAEDSASRSSTPETEGNGPQNLSGQITSSPSPTSTYFWTPRPQIADAPRVPDAPAF